MPFVVLADDMPLYQRVLWIMAAIFLVMFIAMGVVMIVMTFRNAEEEIVDVDDGGFY